MNSNEHAPLLEEARCIENEERNNNDQRIRFFERKETFLGGLLALLCSLGFSLSNFLVKTFQLDVLDFLIVRSLAQLILFGIWNWKNGRNFWPKPCEYEDWKDFAKISCILIVQAACSEVVISLTVVSVDLMPIGDALTIIWCSPVFVIILSRLIFKHRVGLYKGLIIILLLLGTLFVIQPPSIFPVPNDGPHSNKTNMTQSAILETKNFYSGSILAAICAFCAAFNVICIYSLRQFHQNMLIFNASVAGVLFALISSPFDSHSLIFHNIGQTDFPKLIGVSVLGITSLLLFIISCQKLQPTIFTILRSQEILFAFLLQVFVNHNVPSTLTLIGGILVLMSGIAAPFEEKMASKLPCQRFKTYF